MGWVKNTHAQVFWLGINNNEDSTKNQFSPFLIKIDTDKSKLNVLNRENEVFPAKIATIALNDVGSGYVATENGNIYQYRLMQRTLARSHFASGIRTISVANKYLWLGGEFALTRCEISDINNCVEVDRSIEHIAGMALDDSGSGWIITQNGRLHRYKDGEYVETTQVLNGYPQALQLDSEHQQIVIDLCDDVFCAGKYQVHCDLSGSNCDIPKP